MLSGGVSSVTATQATAEESSSNGKLYSGNMSGGISGKRGAIRVERVSAPIIPTSMPAKKPKPFNRHQYHLRTFAAVYPPQSAETIHCRALLMLGMYKPIAVLMTTTTTVTA